MRILDLFCGAGGAAVGYHRAFPDATIVGVDIASQPNYPFIFGRHDLLALDSDIWVEFDLIHASPPCQHFTRYRNNVKDIATRYENLIEPVRERLQQLNIPYVIENVEGAPLESPVKLCGSMFGLDVRRHRLFETNWPLPQPACNHKVWTDRKYKGSTGRGNRFTIEVGAWNEKLELQKQCMGVDWKLTLRELSEAVPPAYTEWIGQQFAQRMRTAA